MIVIVAVPVVDLDEIWIVGYLFTHFTDSPPIRFPGFPYGLVVVL